MTTDGIDKKFIKEIQHPNFVERHEEWTVNDTDPPIKMASAYTADGHYIGNLETAKYICDERGIKPELREPNMNVCSVGFCEKDGKWYGWSHRAMVGFKVGDKLFEEKFGNDETPYVKHGAKDIANLDEARESASRFAESVASAVKLNDELKSLSARNESLANYYNGEVDIQRVFANRSTEVIPT